jgi:hypothetical protein
MTSPDDLVDLADNSLFIFTGSIAPAATPAAPTADRSTVAVRVEDVIKVPVGFHRLAGTNITMHLQEPLHEGDYVFFADPVAVGQGLDVRERAHLPATERARVEAAVKRGYALLIKRRAEAATFVVLGEVGTVTPLLPPAEWRKQVPWALAPLEVERQLKGKGKRSRLTLIGPVRGSKRIPRAPALRAGLKAVFILHRPPPDALRHVPDDADASAVFIADTSDIQPLERLETIERILRGGEQV